MIFRLGRHRRRNLYVQHSREPSDDDVFVALFEDEAVAARVCRLLNADEARHLGQTAQVLSPHEENLRTVLQLALDEMECANPVCRHPQAMHAGVPMHPHACTSPDPACTCVEFVPPSGMWQVNRPEALREQEENNPFCQRDGCVHHRSEHEWGTSACRSCFCASFVEVHP